jgi:hypothetical protein
MLSRRSFWSGIVVIPLFSFLRAADVQHVLHVLLLRVAPFFHTFGLVIVWCAEKKGGCLLVACNQISCTGQLIRFLGTGFT